MIDSDGFRSNVGIILSSCRGQVLWARRIGGNDAWQFPQGGIHKNETAEEAMFREMKEETGLESSNTKIIACTKGWLRYRLPKRLIRKGSMPLCIGQKQKWFLLKLLASDSHIKLNSSIAPEFDSWCWVSYWYPLYQVVAFKREVYRRALKELSPFLAKI